MLDALQMEPLESAPATFSRAPKVTKKREWPTPEEIFAKQRGNRFNMSLAEYEHLLELQGGACAICFCKETKLTKAGDPQALSIDHCHETGMIRGLLCSSCNTLLGLAKDSILVLLNAASYVEQARKRWEEATPAILDRARGAPK